MKLQKLSYYTDAVRTSNLDCQEENFILGLVKFFDNYNIFYNLIRKIEEDNGTKCTILPSFNHDSEDYHASNFRLLRVKIDNVTFQKLVECYSEIRLNEISHFFQFFLEDETAQQITVQIEMV